MRVIKKINNNVAGCIDDNGNELVAFGKGIGFPKVPYVLDDLSKIERTFYGVDPNYLGLFQEIPQKVFDVSASIVDYAGMHLDHELNSNVVFTLADHINFAVERIRKGIHVKQPYVGDIAYLHEKEYQIGEKAVKYINEQLHVHLPKEEAVGIALHFINAEYIPENHKDLDEETVIQEITEIVEQYFSIEIDRKGFNYNRFVTHLQYLLKRLEKHEDMEGSNAVLLPGLKEQYPDIYRCALKINDYLDGHFHQKLTEEEIVYLMLHINRMCAREQK